MDVVLLAVKFVAGEFQIEQIPVVDFSEDIENSVKLLLQGIPNKSKNAFEKRLKTSPIIDTIYDSFETYSWYKESTYNSTV